jgi:radical SAM protein
MTPFDRAPFIAIWEVTRACDLACRHCRAEAQPEPAADELTTAEGKALLRSLRERFGQILVVLTGGDPLKRDDIFELAAAGDALGLRMAITPSATPLLTPMALARLRSCGIKRIALSLDGADAETHDAFRGIHGTYARTLRALQTAASLGMEVQVNTTIGPHNLGQIQRLARICDWLGARLWSVFQMVPTGRAHRAMVVTAAEHERVYRELAALALDPHTSFDIKTTAGQPFQRVLAQERARREREGVPTRAACFGRAPGAVNDGKGFVFIGRTGDICPSGFLPLVAGNVRQHDIADVYRSHPLFMALRDPHLLEGKCGRCEFNGVCGGSRSRAFALLGDPLASDPTCAYQPRGAA